MLGGGAGENTCTQKAMIMRSREVSFFALSTRETGGILTSADGKGSNENGELHGEDEKLFKS